MGRRGSYRGARKKYNIREPEGRHYKKKARNWKTKRRKGLNCYIVMPVVVLFYDVGVMRMWKGYTEEPQHAIRTKTRAN